MQQKEELRNEFWSASRIYKGSNLKIFWNLVLCAGLWTIWLARNELVFNYKALDLKSLIILVKIRASKWILAIQGIKHELQTL